MPNYVPGMGPSQAKLMIVGEAPGADEDRLQIPFIGKSGAVLNDLLEGAGTKRDQVYLTNVVKYRPPNNDFTKIHLIDIDLEKSIAELREEIYAIKPNCILALGNHAVKALTGRGRGKESIKNLRGSILETNFGHFKLIPTIHPAALLRLDDEGSSDSVFKPTIKEAVKHDFARAVAQAEFPEIRRPHRRLEIIRDSVNLERFLNHYLSQGFKIVSVDIEVKNSLPFCIGLAFNNWHGISVPLIDVFQWQGKESVQPNELQLIWAILSRFFHETPGLKVIGQNFKFDDDKLRHCCGIIPPDIYCDVMWLHHCLYPEFDKSLGFMASIWTEEPYYKHDEAEFDPKKQRIEDYLIYNARDVVVTFEVWEGLHKEAAEVVVPGFPDWRQTFCYDYIMKLHPFYRDMENEGFPINSRRRAELILDYSEKIKAAVDELHSLVGWDINPASPRQVADLLYKDLRFPLRKGKGRKRLQIDEETGLAIKEGQMGDTGEDTLVGLQANHAKTDAHRRIIDLILLIRALKKSVNTYFKAKPDYDGRMKTQYSVCGTETGRSSTKLLKPPVRPEKIGLSFHTMTKHGEVGPEVRGYMMADEGHTIMEFDLSQAEARIVALLGKSEETLALFNTTDIHKLTATWIFGGDFKGITKPKRFIGKTTRHAGNYDMKKNRFMHQVNTDAKKFKIDMEPISEWKAGQILTVFHKFSPWIKEVFHTGVVDALQHNERTIVNPYGRRRQFFARWGEDLFKEAYAFIPQSTVADKIKHSALKLRSMFPELRFTVEAHDALVFMIPDDKIAHYALPIKAVLEEPIDFIHCTLSRHSLVIPCEAKTGKNYRDLVDFDLKALTA